MKRLFTLNMLLLMAIVMMAGNVTPEEARQKAAEFLANTNHGARAMKAKQWKSRLDQATNTPVQNLYIFNISDNDGFVFVSNDDHTAPILGYATQGNFGKQTLPENLRWWLETCDRQLEKLASLPANVKIEPLRTPRADVSPLVTTHWDQSAPFNNLCPDDGLGNCLSGCVATAMAQIMNYHRYPTNASTAIPGYDDDGTQRDALSSVIFDWSNMLNDYDANYTDAQATAVATLMKYCGYAVNMGYGTDFSGAYSGNVATALKQYFNYDKGVKYISRDNYTIDEWEGLIYNELAQKRPVYYSGASTGGGHAFVCDGYGKDGLFHINWGWSGYCDGFYSLALLAPGGSGSGGSATSDGYSIGQDIVVGIQPNTGVAPQSNAPYLTGTVHNSNNTTLKFDIYNDNEETVVVDFGFAIVKENGTLESVYSNWFGSEGLPFGYGIFDHEMDINDVIGGLPAGNYRLVLYSAPHGSTDYRSALPSHMYWELTVNSDNTATVIAHPVISLQPTAWEDGGNHLPTISQKVNVTIKNNGDECNQTVALLYRLKGEKEWSNADATQSAVILRSGESGVIPFYFTPEDAGTYEVTVAKLLGQDDYEYLECIHEYEIYELPIMDYALSNGDIEKVLGATSTLKTTISNPESKNYLIGFKAYLFAAPDVPDDYLYFKEEKMISQAIGANSSAEVSVSFDNITPNKQHMVILYYGSYDGYNITWDELCREYFIWDGSDTGIQLSTAKQQQPTGIYGIDGKLIKTDAIQQLPKGTYIISGKKIIK